MQKKRHKPKWIWHLDDISITGSFDAGCYATIINNVFYTLFQMKFFFYKWQLTIGVNLKKGHFWFRNKYD